MPNLLRFVVHGFVIVTAIAAMTHSAAVAAQESVETPPPPPAAEDTARREPAVVIEEIPEVDEAAAEEPRRPEMEEIIVIAPKPGDRRRLDDDLEDPVRAQLLKDFYREQEFKEEFEWRQAGADTSSSRIKLGYDPRDDYRMRNEMALQDMSWEKTKPATIFRIEF